MRNTLFITVLLFIFNITIRTQWQTYYASSNSITFNDVSVVDVNIIWACGGNPGKVVRTTNGGLNWIDATGNLNPNFLGHVEAVDEINAWTCGDTNREKIFRTTNGGVNWTQQFYSQPDFINEIIFFNINTGVFLRDPLYYPTNDTSGFFITRNGGLNWYRSPNSPRTTQLIDGYFWALDTNLVWFTDYRKVYKLNGGLDNQWQISTIDTLNPAIVVMQFINDTIGYAASGITSPPRLIIFKTTNGGFNWFVQSSDSLMGPLAMQYIPNTNMAFMNSVNEIRVSTDMGLSWIYRVKYRYQIDSTGLFYMDAYDTNSVWIPANKGRLLKYNINYIGIEKTGSIVPDVFKLSQNYPNPFNPKTRIRFALPEAVDFNITIYDVLGREVYSIADHKEAGEYEFIFDGANYPSGVYFYKLETGEVTISKKMILIK